MRKFFYTVDNPEFKEQVDWELEHLESADLIVFYFDPNGKAPITLLEIGLFVSEFNNIIVCCPEGYWRKGNVDVVCNRYGIKQVDNLEQLVYATQQWIVERERYA